MNWWSGGNREGQEEREHEGETIEKNDKNISVYASLAFLFTIIHTSTTEPPFMLFPINSELYSLSKETLASVREWLTSFSRRLGSRYNVNRRDNSSMKSAVVTALRFHFSLMAISFSLACTGGKYGGGREGERGGREGEREGGREGRRERIK